MLGCALALYNEVAIEVGSGDSGEATVVTHVDDDPEVGVGDGIDLGATTLPSGGDNYCALGADAVFRLAGVKRPDYRIAVTQRIPVSRGLGSSAAALVGGAVAANALLDDAVSESEIVFALADVEGHTEQLSAAMFGGLVGVAPPDERPVPGLTRAGTPSTFGLDLAESLSFALAIPDVTLSTKTARSVLPHEVPFQDAVANLAALAALTTGLADADPFLVGVGMRDTLHQPYRAELMPESLDVLSAARDAGAYGACWSGAGPTMLAICGDEDTAEAVAEAMASTFASAGTDAVGVVVGADVDGATVVELDGEPYSPVVEDELWDEDEDEDED